MLEGEQGPRYRLCRLLTKKQGINDKKYYKDSLKELNRLYDLGKIDPIDYEDMKEDLKQHLHGD